jgi:hypothetical protein
MGISMSAFGWRADEFWRATPHEFYSLVEARAEENRRIENSM